MTVDIRLGDWRDVLEGTYDPARAVVITDPPYGLDRDKGYIDTVPWAEHVRAVLERLPAKRYAIRGPAPSLVRRDYPEPRRICVEVATFRRRAAQRPGVIPYLWQGWAIYGRLKVERKARMPTGDALVVRPYSDDGLRGSTASGMHRGLTPYASALWAVELWADPGSLVLDPYAGTGTIGRACAALGLDYIGAEIEPRWYDLAYTTLAYNAPSLGLA